jgi:TPR repeat protein
VPQVQMRQAAASQTQIQPPAAAQPPVAQPNERTVSPEEIAKLINAAKSFLAQGDIANARRYLEHAGAQDATAALMLGGTYDPNVLRKMGVVGLAPDLEKARAWYTRAAELGSREASQKLAALAGAPR